MSNDLKNGFHYHFKKGFKQFKVEIAEPLPSIKKLNEKTENILWTDNDQKL